MGKANENNPAQRCRREMTVAHIREREGAATVEVAFLESARFYRLLPDNPARDAMLKRLRDAMKTREVLKIDTASPDSDVIDGIS